MEPAVASIPQTLPINIFGSSVVAENSVIASNITANTRLYADGSSIIAFNNTITVAAALDVYLPYEVDTNGNVTYANLGGTVRQIVNTTSGAGAARTLLIKKVDTVDGSGNPATSTTLATLLNPADAGTTAGKLVGVSLACTGDNGTPWFTFGRTVVPG